MNPENRLLVKVSVDDYIQADSMFEILMGKYVKPRYEFITEHSKAFDKDKLDI